MPILLLSNLLGTDHAMLLATDPVGYAGCCAAIRDMDQRPTSFLNTSPTLVIAGAQDPATPVAASEFLAERACHGRIEILADAARLSNVEQPEAFLKSVLAFLA